MSDTKQINLSAKSIWAFLAAVVVASLVATGTAMAGNVTAFGTDACGASATCGTGGNDSAFGLNALEDNSSGSDNTATGTDAMQNNTMGGFNTATGAFALNLNQTGEQNTANGNFALEDNSTGSDNTATGFEALQNSTGSDNTAMGNGALENLTSGDNNIAVGFDAGSALTTGSNDIDIGANGIAGESNTTRIGSATQTSAYIGGVFGVIGARGGLPVLVGPQGHLFTQVSSVRFKRDVHDMGDASDKLMKLRPVTFRYRQDPDGTPQYGLIAEEVKKVYPAMVVYDDKGQVEGVRYDQLPAMLLNQVQKLTAELKQKDTQMKALTERMDALERQARLAAPEHIASAMR